MLPVYGPIGAIGTAVWLVLIAWREHPIGMAVLTAMLLACPAFEAGKAACLVLGVASRHPITLWRRWRKARHGV